MAESNISSADVVNQGKTLKVIQAQEVVRTTSLKILKDLDDIGVEDVTPIVCKLLLLEAEETHSSVSTVDLFSVAQAFDKERQATPDDGEKRSYKRLAALAHSVGAVAAFKAVTETSGKEAKYANVLFDNAAHSLELSADDISQKAYTTLAEVVTRSAR